MSQPKTLLMMAHPGHELRVLQWLKHTQPQVCILTNGSGRTTKSRLHHSQRLLQSAGASSGPIMGAFSDQVVYQEVLAGNTDFFLQMAEDLLNCVSTHHHEVIAGDAAEGYNTTHDLCRGIIDAVVHKYQQHYQRPLVNLAFPLIQSPVEAPQGLSELETALELDEASFVEKHAQAKQYAALEAEVAFALEQIGLEPFRFEYLWKQVPWLGFDAPVVNPPFYEVYGKKQVLLGHYPQAIVFDNHLKPILQKLRAWAEA